MKKIFVQKNNEWVETEFLNLKRNDVVMVEGEIPSFRVLCKPFKASDGKTVVYYSQIGGDK
jgi:hypothetical protein